MYCCILIDFQLNITPEIMSDFLKQRDTWLALTVVLGILFLVIICLFIFLREVTQCKVDNIITKEVYCRESRLP